MRGSFAEVCGAVLLAVAFTAAAACSTGPSLAKTNSSAPQPTSLIVASERMDWSRKVVDCFATDNAAELPNEPTRKAVSQIVGMISAYAALGGTPAPACASRMSFSSGSRHDWLIELWWEDGSDPGAQRLVVVREEPGGVRLVGAIDDMRFDRRAGRVVLLESVERRPAVLIVEFGAENAAPLMRAYTLGSQAGIEQRAELQLPDCGVVEPDSEPLCDDPPHVPSCYVRYAGTADGFRVEAAGYELTETCEVRDLKLAETCSVLVHYPPKNCADPARPPVP